MPLPNPNKGEERSKFISRCISFAVGDGMEQEKAVAACNTQWRSKQKANNLLLEFNVPITESATIDNEFIINGIAISETTTSYDDIKTIFGLLAKFPAGFASLSSNTTILLPISKMYQTRSVSRILYSV